jgi:hypothetical protein
MEKLKKTELVKIAKNNKLKGYSKLNKNDLLQFLNLELEKLSLNNDCTGVEELRFDELKITKCPVPEEERLNPVPEEERLNPVPAKKLNPVPAKKLNPVPAKKLNPVQELDTKLKQLTNPIEIENLKLAYAYRIWLWNNYSRTFEEEMNRFDKTT